MLVSDAEYVALGSSFAAGIGLGPRAPDSPIVCQRSLNGYPQQLARLRGLSLTDMTCSGATLKHVKNGGQYFLGPQIAAIGPGTRLVTITAGGNDVGYVADLTALAFQKKGGLVGFLIQRLWKGPKAVADRDFESVQRDMIAALREIARRAPGARIVVVTYPAILPPTGDCTALLLDDAQAKLMRQVAARLLEVTRAAAQAAGALVVDMDSASAGHDACSPEPWVCGPTPARGAPFHPTLDGAEATARQILRVIDDAS